MTIQELMQIEKGLTTLIKFYKPKDIWFNMNSYGGCAWGTYLKEGLELSATSNKPHYFGEFNALFGFTGRGKVSDFTGLQATKQLHKLRCKLVLLFTINYGNEMHTKQWVKRAKKLRKQVRKEMENLS